VTFTPNHWSNKEKTLEYINEVILPVVQVSREELKFQPHQPPLVTYDEFKGQLLDPVHSFMDSNNIYNMYGKKFHQIVMTAYSQWI